MAESAAFPFIFLAVVAVVAFATDRIAPVTWAIGTADARETTMASEAELGTIIQDAIARGVQELRGFGFAVIAPADRPALEAKVAKALSAERSCCPTYELCRFCTIDARIALDTIFGEAGE